MDVWMSVKNSRTKVSHNYNYMGIERAAEVNGVDEAPNIIQVGDWAYPVMYRYDVNTGVLHIHKIINS